MSYDNPNFTVITSGGCNSHCEFCTDSFNRKESPEYLANLAKAIFTQIPDHFTQVSVSGGEPTLSKDLRTILNMLRYATNPSGGPRFHKVVMTTNGAQLTKHIELLKDTIHHLNVSRHAIGYEENVKVFGTKNIAKDEDIRDAAFELNKAGIDVNFNHVYTAGSALTMDYVLQYVDYARSLGATSVSFRYDQNENSLEPTYLEKLFSEWKTTREGGCPVCRNHTVLVKGMPVVFKASYAEPSKTIDDVYELVYHITGKLTTDWEGLKEFTPELAAKYTREWQKNPNKQHAIIAAVDGISTGRQASSAAQKSNVPVKANYGGGCGNSTGGGCGSFSAPTQAPKAKATRTIPIRSTPSYGGGCGTGGGCGS